MRSLVFALCSLLVACNACNGPPPPRAAKFGTGYTRNGTIDTATAKTVQTVEAHVSADTAAPGASFQDLLTLSITTTTGTNLRIYSAVSLPPDPSSSTGCVGFQVTLDGVAVPGGQFYVSGGPYGGVSVPGSNVVLPSTTAGAHTVKLQWEAVVGTGMHINANSIPLSQYARIIATEEIVP